MHANNKIAIVFGLLIVAGTAFAPIFGPASLVDLQKNADLIVVGSASSGSSSGDISNFTILVDRVVKGDGVAGTLIPASWQSSNPVSLATGHGLWFLKRSPGGWRVLPTQSGWAQFSDIFIPVPVGVLPRAYTYETAASISDKVASEISASIESGLGRGLWTTMLDQLNSPVIQLLYQRMSASSSPPQKIFGLSGLIRSGSPDALSLAIQAAPGLSTSTVEYGILLQSIGNDFRASDANSITVLGKAALKNNLSQDFRESVAHALRAIHTKDTLPYLAALLDDSDIKLQAEGVGGLASFANGLPIQTSASVPSLSYLQLPDRAPFKTSDTVSHLAMGEAAIAHLSFWKTWWSQNRIALGY